MTAEKLTIRKSFIDKKGLVRFEYPDNYTQQQRGFTPSGSAKLNFPIMKRMEIKQERQGIDNVSRKPTRGSKRILQVITNFKEMIIPERYNLFGELIRKAMKWKKPVMKVIHHTRPLRDQKPLFAKID